MSLKNVSRTVFSPMRVKGVFNSRQIEDIVAVTSLMTHDDVYAPLFLLALFGFLCLSNLVPLSLSQFDPTTHLARGDLLHSPSHGTLIIKWTKTLQRSQHFATIQIPVLRNSPLCPMTALPKNILHLQIPPCSLFPRVPLSSHSLSLTLGKHLKTSSYL